MIRDQRVTRLSSLNLLGNGENLRILPTGFYRPRLTHYFQAFELEALGSLHSTLFLHLTTYREADSEGGYEESLLNRHQNNLPSPFDKPVLSEVEGLRASGYPLK